MEKTIALTKKSDIFKMVIPKKVEQKIRFVCQNVWDVEWSGVLFYKYSGTFENKDLTITCEDIFIMDVGSSAYTEFNMTPKVAGHIAEHPELMDCQTGLVHSHNNMATFLSGTDTNTLRDEGAERHNFVSLIVNNAGNYTAAITRKVQHVKKVEDCCNYKFFGEEGASKCTNYETVDTEVEYYYLDITKEGEDYSSLEERIKELKSAKSQNKMSFATYPQGYNKGFGQQKTLFDYPEVKSTPVFNAPVYNTKKTNPNTTKDKTSSEIDKLACQIVTGCIVVNDSKINLDTFIPRMKDIYSKRFENIEDFMLWADTYCEYLLWYSDETKYGTEEDASDNCAVLAALIMDKLTTYPSNEYLDGYIEVLDKFTKI